MPVWAAKATEKEPEGPIFSPTSMLVALSSSSPPYSSGASIISSPSSPHLRIPSTTLVEILVLDLLGMGEDFVGDELLGRFGDLLLLVGEVLGGEDFAAAHFGDQVLAAF